MNKEDTLKPNMYVRTDEGIRKILREYDKGFELNRSLHYLYPEGHDLYKEDLEELEIKASYNIIDLIEAGDYINGQRVYYDEELDYLYVQCIDGDGNLYYESITKQSFIDNIKSIITKEQMEQMSYKIKE